MSARVPRYHQQSPPSACGAEADIRYVDLGDRHPGRVGHGLPEPVLDAVDIVLEIADGEIAADGHDQRDSLGVGAPEARVADAVEEGGAASAGVGSVRALRRCQGRGAVGVGGTVGAIGRQSGAHEGEFAHRARGAAGQTLRARRIAKGAGGAIRRHAGPRHAELPQRACGAMRLRLGARGGSE